jgi:hypothetical protein
MTGILTPDERAIAVARLSELIHQAMETVRFTGRMQFRGGQWVGVYGLDPTLTVCFNARMTTTRLRLIHEVLWHGAQPVPES